ncbi:MAG: leucyl aminopeptidase [Desulfobacteraceae bacterium]|nr:leucyl aminopeptidase [Desulfobacteraceae bacterium]
MLKIIKFSELEAGSEITAIGSCENINEFCGEKKYFALEKRARELEEFKGEEDKTIVFYSPENINAKKMVVCGFGKKENISSESYRRFASNAVKQALSLKASSLDIIIPDFNKADSDKIESFKAICEGAYLSNYSFNEYKSKKEEQPLKEIRIPVLDENIEEFKKIADQTEKICSCVFFARNIVSTPPMDKRPEKLKNLLVDFASRSGLQTQVFDNAKLEELGFNSHLGVAKGSSEGAYLVIMEYTPKNYDETIALVGKGITFDSGGLDLKPPSGMEDMKLDMGGAAAVTGAAAALAKLGINKRIIAVVPIAENMISGDSYRPGDVLKSYLGKTIEVLNTDAEGRLILADALSYTEKLFNPDLIIDAATLTGACMVALGDKIAGVFTDREEIGSEIVKTGKKINEPCWMLPVFKDYAKKLKSSVADLKNIGGGRYGGAITAALFLKEFVEKTDYVHLDIAGPAFSQEAGHYTNKGGTGFGVRLITEYVMTRESR